MMKKTYISPTFVAVDMHSRSTVLTGSLRVSSETADEGGWVKEDYPPINDRNVWDDEW